MVGIYSFWQFTNIYKVPKNVLTNIGAYVPRVSVIYIYRWVCGNEEHTHLILHVQRQMSRHILMLTMLPHVVKGHNKYRNTGSIFQYVSDEMSWKHSLGFEINICEGNGERMRLGRKGNVIQTINVSAKVEGSKFWLSELLPLKVK